MKKTLIIIGAFFLSQTVGTILLLLFHSLQNPDSRLADFNTNSLSTGEIMLSVLISNLILIIAVPLICRKKFLEPFRWPTNSTVRKKNVTFRFTFILYSVLTLIPIILFTDLLSEQLMMEDKLGDIFQNMSHHWLALPTMAIIGPLAEELSFRYGVIGSLKEKYPRYVWVAVVASALLFGLVHMNPAQIPAAIIVGLYFGWLYLKSGSLWPSFVCHMLNNFIAVMSLIYLDTDFKLEGLLPNHDWTYPTMAICVVVTAILILFTNKYLCSFDKSQHTTTQKDAVSSGN